MRHAPSDAFPGRADRKHESYVKTAALLHALLTVLPRKRFYFKCDVDTLLRPEAITRCERGTARL
eukprot:2894340-Prymnesium_polylepis.1